MIRNENVKIIEMILENKNYSRSSQSKNLTLSKFVHFENDDKISFKKNEMLENFFNKNVMNQLKFKSIEFATNLCFSTKNKIIKSCSYHF